MITTAIRVVQAASDPLRCLKAVALSSREHPGDRRDHSWTETWFPKNQDLRDLARFVNRAANLEIVVKGLRFQPTRVLNKPTGVETSLHFAVVAASQGAVGELAGSMGDSDYSFSLTTFSPSGKLVQIEYALNAVAAGSTSLGIKGARRCPPACVRSVADAVMVGLRGTPHMFSVNCLLNFVIGMSASPTACAVARLGCSQYFINGLLQTFFFACF